MSIIVNEVHILKYSFIFVQVYYLVKPSVNLKGLPWPKSRFF